jgi:amino acid transporter
MASGPARLHRTLTTLEYFTFGFGTMIGVGWVILMDDWLGRGGPGGAMLGFGLGGLLLLPVALTYARLVRHMPDAGAEIAYTDGVFPPSLSFLAGWTMVLAYAIVCPWEAVAVGNLLARAFPQLNSYPLYEVAGRTIFAPRLLLGLVLTFGIVALNHRGIERSGRFQNVTTFGLIAVFLLFAGLGFVRGDSANLQPFFRHPGSAGAWLSILLVLQIVPYYMTGFESVAKGSEEAAVGYDTRGFARAIVLALVSGAAFYALVVMAASLVYPWTAIVEGRVGTELAFERAFGSRALAQIILLGAFLSLLKIYNGNFVAATRLVFAMGRRGLVHRDLGYVHPVFGTPSRAILWLGLASATASFLGDAVLVPITDVGSLASGIGWFSACAAYLGRTSGQGSGRALARLGALVAGSIVLMKITPWVPGSFGRWEWAAFAAWTATGWLLWIGRSRQPAPAAIVANH